MPVREQTSTLCEVAPSSSAQDRPADELSAGRAVGEYKVVSKVAEGGMGTVYRAAHPVIGKDAAVKVLSRNLSDRAGILRRFVDEARAVNKIRHPNIVDIFAFGALEDGRSYFVMEWLTGRTLEDEIYGRRLSVGDAVEILDQLCDALEAAHQKNIIHRDIKPANVFLVDDRNTLFVKLLDFGIAKLGFELDGSEEGAVMGTPAYISPEQLGGEDVGSEADVYSLGVMAYEMFAGRMPFLADDPRSFLIQHVKKAPASPRTFATDLPEAIEDMLLGMLKKDPSERPSLARVRKILDELRRAEKLRSRAPLPTDSAGPPRPILRRHFTQVAHLSHVVVSELSRGVAWVEASGHAPMVDTPVEVRFEVPRYGVCLKFGGLVSRHFGSADGRTLIRYDNVPKERLERVFAALADAGRAGVSPSSQTNEAVWEYVSAPVSLAASASGIQSQTSRHETLDALRSRDGRPLKAKKAQRAVLGLWVKVLAVMLLVTLAAVASVAVKTLVHAKRDRGFYAHGLAVRSAQLMAKAFEARVSGWHDRLRLIVGARNTLEVAKGAFSSIEQCEKPARTSRFVCRAPMVGTGLDEPLRAMALKKASSQGYTALVPNLGVLLSARLGRRVAIGLVPAHKLFDSRTMPEELHVSLIDNKGQTLEVNGTEGGTKSVDQGSPLGLDALLRTAGVLGADPPTEERARAGDFEVLVSLPGDLSLKSVRALAGQVLRAFFVVAMLALLASVLFARSLTRRLRELNTQAARVAEGNFEALKVVGGRDEVGQLARSLDSMASSLRKRDEDVLRIQQRISEDESETLQRQMSERLETDLASMLQSIQAVTSEPIDHNRPMEDLRDRQARLLNLSTGAVSSLQQALAIASMSSRRLDFASTVREAIAYARSQLYAQGVSIHFDAPNAVLFPRLDARESEIRAAVQHLVSHGVQMSKAREVLVSVLHEDAYLVLSVRYLGGGASKEIIQETLKDITSILDAHDARAEVTREADELGLRLAFPVGVPGQHAEKRIRAEA